MEFRGSERSTPFAGTNEVVVTTAGTNCPVIAIGFRRRVLYAPLKKRDLRVGNYLYLKLANPIADGQKVEVKNPDAKLWAANQRFTAVLDPLRWSPAIHANQVGYAPALPKKAMVGYFIGSLGEMELPGATGEKSTETNPSGTSNPSEPAGFKLIEAQTGRVVYEGKLAPRPDRGFSFPCYMQVMEADFSEYKVPGEYRLLVPGLGASFPFFIDEGMAAAFARTYALGLYHQRCGTDNALPFTRFTHGPCHTAPAEIPMPQSRLQVHLGTIAEKSSDFAENPRHTAPQLKRRGVPTVSLRQAWEGGRGGRASRRRRLQQIHHQQRGLDSLSWSLPWMYFPARARSTISACPKAAMAKAICCRRQSGRRIFWRKCRMTTADFIFLVYPREREYEIDVPPDHGDPQVVWPKTTAVTAAAVAALAQCASSPEFKKQFPEAAALYLKKARRAGPFSNAPLRPMARTARIKKSPTTATNSCTMTNWPGRRAKCFWPPARKVIIEKLLAWLNPSGETRRWGWWRMYEAYGCAIRSYAFAATAGKIKRGTTRPALLGRCEDEIIAAAQDQLRRSDDSAYATSFPEETKRSRSAGWYFSGDAAFDLAVACQLDYPIMNDPRPKFLEAILGNLNYEAGCNPVNVCYLTGLGWKRQREIVDQYAAE